MNSGCYFITPGAEPHFNMAFDNWLFENISNGQNKIPAYMRLYSWSSPAITYGYNQSLSRILNRNLLPENTPVIKRITGGRAIYHDISEITFSLIANLEIFPENRRGLAQVNGMISESIVEILNKVGINSNWAKSSASDFMTGEGARTKACFSSHSRYEVFAEGRKIAAGAQRRAGMYFIHQGSLKVNGIAPCPAIGQQGMDEDYSTSTGGRNRKYDIADFKTAFGDVFSRKLGLVLTESDLPEEWLYDEE